MGLRLIMAKLRSNLLTITLQVDALRLMPVMLYINGPSMDSEQVVQLVAEDKDRRWHRRRLGP